MQLAPFLLDQWLNQYQFADPPIQFDLASSTGPHWSLKQLNELLDPDEQQRLLDSDLFYSHSAGSSGLREAIASMQGVDARHVQIVTGASEALLIIFFLASQPDANVIVPFPGFPPFAELPRSFGLETRFYYLRPENDYRIDLDEIEELADSRTRLILLNSPHNPTGATLSDDELGCLHDLGVERGIQVVVDEVYHPIYHGPETSTAATLPQVTVLGDFSKALCLSGLRVGWIVERDQRRMEEYLGARSYFTVSNGPLSESLAAAAVHHRKVILSRALQIASSNLALLDQFFEELSDILAWVRPKGGMTAFPWLRSGADSRSFCQEVAAHGVLLVPGDCFGMPAHFRIGFGASGSGFRFGLEMLAGLVKRYAK